MVSSGKAIQATVLFSVILGVLFLWEVNGLVPSFVFDFVAAGWALFVVDGVLTFFKPEASYGLAFILALLALSSSLPQSAHYAFIQEGAVLQAATFLVGTAAQLLLVALVPVHFFTRRRRSSSGPTQGS